ncbi:MAG: aldo/keto reductase [Bryobacterales bacterium]|nr:aldo/keto reductase [Bryobacterales bacterium]MBV9398056.1 aldo/keto reductase [Bryobacterales bacterium]
MEKRNIGSLEVSVVGIGCNNFGWRIDAAGTAKVVEAALDAGINFFDTADMYGGGKSEEFLGAALGSKRKQIVLATKFGLPMDEHRRGAKPAYVRQAVDDSLRRLGTEFIDLYQLHTPDASTPIGDTLETLDELVKVGKVREIGCSNFSVQQLREAAGAVKPGAARFVSVQNEYSLIRRDPEQGVLAECVRQGIGFIPYFPLANGLLTGKYRGGQPLPEGSRAKDGFGPKIFTEENVAKAEALGKFAESRGHTLLELAVSWLAGQTPVASVIAGAKTPEQVRANASAANWKLTRQELAEVGQILTIAV